MKTFPSSPSLINNPWERSQQKLNEIELTDEFFTTDNGCYRWRPIRGAYMNGFITIDRVVGLYKKWRDQKEYLWLEAIDINTEEVKGNFFFKCSKRGNDVYKDRLKQRFNFLDRLDPIYFFLDTDKNKCSPMLFITLTVDPKKYNVDSAWFNISHELHIFDTKLRQAFGNFVKFRVWEAHESGFPHVHIALYFNKKWFKVFKHNNKFRITTKHKKQILSYWAMGNVDIQAVQDTHGAFNEVKKYITKNIWNSKGDLTNAMVCLHDKQMYSLSRCDPFKKRIHYWKKHGLTDWKDQERTFMSNISKWAKKDFIGAIWGSQIYFQFYKECGNLAEPGTTALVKGYLHNCNNIDFKFRYVGVVLFNDLCDFIPHLEPEWIIQADPPPEFKAYMGFEPLGKQKEIDFDSLELD